MVEKSVTVGLLKKVRLLRRCAPRNDKKHISVSLWAWPQGADSKNRVTISSVAVALFQQLQCPEFLLDKMIKFKKI